MPALNIYLSSLSTKMGRAPCCSKVGLHRGPWTSREDALLTKYIQAHGEGQWRSLPKSAGLLRCGKSCRLRWMNYLRPDIKRGNITPEEDDLIIRMHSLLGNRWSLIAGRLPGRTDNEIKNYWNTHLIKKLKNQEQPEQEKKKKKKKQKNEKNKIKTKVSEDSEKKTLVYLPKAMRVKKSLSYVIPRTDNTINMEPNSVTTSQKEEEQRVETKEGENDGFGLFFGEQCHEDLVNNNDMECQTGFLEKLYEEYLQLLKNEENHEKLLDSFAESLLV